MTLDEYLTRVIKAIPLPSFDRRRGGLLEVTLVTSAHVDAVHRRSFLYIMFTLMSSSNSASTRKWLDMDAM